jgi:hypothetical protein
MPYTLRYSDLTKDSTVTVPDMPPGINAVDTSLSLVGRGYPNYGEKIAESFLHLLENFSGPIPPENPIEGQLWYDTSDVSRKVLRVMDGTATATRWPSANGIYQQLTDPKDTASAGLKDGDIWVDTAAVQVKIYKNGTWTTVGPTIASGATKTGIEATTRETSTGTTSTVVLNYVDGVIVSVVSNDEFIPQPSIEGFNVIRPGVNIRPSEVDKDYRIWGDADRAFNLKISGINYPGAEFLRKNDYSNRGQVIKGHLVFAQSNAGLRDSNSVNNGVVVDSGIGSEYIQFAKENNNGVLYNSLISGKLILRTNNSGSSLDVVSVGSSLVEFSTTATFSKSVTIAGIISIGDTSTTSIQTLGGVIIAKDATVAGSVSVTSVVSANTLTLGSVSGNGVAISVNNNGTYDIGTVSKQFRNVYVSNVYSTVAVYTTAVNATSVSASSISATTVNATSISTATLVNGSLMNITGEVKSYTTSTVPTGWLLCNGAGYSTSTYVALHTLVGYGFGGSAGTFNVPNITPISATTGTIFYIIKT